MRFEIKAVDPDLAKHWLKNNRGNRPIRLSHVRDLARRMTKGEWMVTHQAIAMTDDGRLLDGQNRLHAIIMSGTTQEITVAYGCDPKTFLALDQGARRSVSDVLGGDKRTIETLSRLARIHLSRPATPAEVREYVVPFADSSQRVTDARMGAVALVTSAPMRAAITLRDVLGQGDYAISLYKALASCDFDALPPVGKGILPRVLSKRYLANTDDWLGLCWYISDPDNRNINKPFIKNPLIHRNDMQIHIERIKAECEAIAAE